MCLVFGLYLPPAGGNINKSIHTSLKRHLKKESEPLSKYPLGTCDSCVVSLISPDMYNLELDLELTGKG